MKDLMMYGNNLNCQLFLLVLMGNTKLGLEQSQDLLILPKTFLSVTTIMLEQFRYPEGIDKACAT
jgi:hypothetical protein